MNRSTRALLFLFVLFPALARADEKPTAHKLLVDYRKTVKKISRFRIETSAKNWTRGSSDERLKDNKDGYVGTEQRTIVVDGDRRRVSTDFTNVLTLDGVTKERRAGVEYLIGDYLGKRQALHCQWMADDDNLNSKFRKIDVWLADDDQPETIQRFLNLSNILFGQTNVDGPGPLWETMRDASSLELSPERELIDKVPTYVLKSRGRYGIHTLWLDPAAGCLPRRIVIDKQPGDLSRESQLGVETPSPTPAPRRANAPRLPKRVLDEFHIEWNDIQLTERQGQYVITGFNLVSRSKSRVDDKREEVEQRTEHRVTNIDFDPDSWPPDAFLPGVSIPEGTKVVTDDLQTRFVWSNGQVRRGE